MPSSTTRLEAVNLMLSGIGEAAVSSLDPDATEDVAMAERVLDEITKAVLGEGWHFNEELEVLLYPDGGGNINIPSNVITIDVNPCIAGTADYVQRDSKLYDKTNHTFDLSKFTNGLKVDVTYFVDFNDCPEEFKRYMMVRAARVFGDRVQGSAQGFDREDEMRARADMLRSDLKNGDSNYGNSYPISAIMRRRSALGGMKTF